MTHAYRPRIARFGASLMLALVLVLGGVCGQAQAATANAQRIVIGFAPSASARERAAVVARSVAGASALDIARGTIASLDVVSVEVPGDQAARVVRELRSRSDVLWVERDHIARATWNPGDPYIGQQWGLSAVRAGLAWDRSRGLGVTIAVVDTGVAASHEDLQGRVDSGYDFVDNDSNPVDVNGHGTHVSGIAAGIAGNGRGGAGLAPQARILAVRVLDANGSGYYSWIAKGITYAADHGARVINLSLGGPDPAQVLKEAIAYAVARGAVVTCASGNDGVGKVSYPAAYDECISVGATTSGGQLASFSNNGEGIDVTAPGEGILSTTKDGSYEAWDGTSMATPFVSGLAALLVSQGLSSRQVIDTITSTARDLGASGYDTKFGNGQIDAAAATAKAAQIGSQPDDANPPVVGIPVLGPVRTDVSTYSVAQWKQVRSTRWRVVGTSGFLGAYSWRDVSRSANTRTFNYYRMRAGLVEQRTVVHRRVTVVRRSYRHVRPVTVSATDDLGVDRVGLKVDGHWVGSDWDATDGWAVPWNCSAGSHTFVVYAWDAHNNQASRQLASSVTC